VGGELLAADSPIINNGGRWWRDADGREIICFPNSVLKVGDTFYMYGEWCFSGENSGLNALRCYSSKDLSRSKFKNNVLTQDDSHLINRGTMLYNEATGKYVYCYKYRRPMRFPGWKVGDGILAWANSSTPTGRFTIANKDPRVGIVAGEVALFKDTDRKAYAVADGTFLAGEGKRINVYELSADYCNIARRVAELGTGQEAASIIKANGKYWCFTSGLNDWYYSATSYRMADNIAGPWTPWTVLQTDPPSTDSFHTQYAGLSYEVRGSAGSVFVWAGLRYWDTIPVRPIIPPLSASHDARPANVWLPLEWKDGVPRLRYFDTWYIDAAAGRSTANPVVKTSARTTPTSTPDGRQCCRLPQ
jgi:hypothetical protein